LKPCSADDTGSAAVAAQWGCPVGLNRPDALRW
jgi:hypothetical protein